MRVLYVLGDVPARGGGGHVRAASTIRALARTADVEVVWPDRPELEADLGLAQTPDVSTSPVPRGGLPGRVRAAARALAAGRPLAVAESTKPALARTVVARLEADAADVVVADRLVAALTCLAAGVPGAVRSVYNAHNVEWKLRAGGGRRERLRWAGTRRLERDVLAAFEQSWMVSEADREAALELWPGADIRVIPNAVDLDAIVPVGSPAGDPVVLMVGSFDYEPNRRGLDWLVRAVMPVVWETRPDARLRVVGRWAGAAWRPHEARVEVCGYVPDLAAAYARTRCCVAPLVVGGGTPLKVIEALAYGLPLVATTTAVRALPALRDGRDVFVADEPAAFARAVLHVLDPAYDHSERSEPARTAIERSYSVDAVADAVARAMAR